MGIGGFKLTKHAKLLLSEICSLTGAPFVPTKAGAPFDVARIHRIGLALDELYSRATFSYETQQQISIMVHDCELLF